MSIPLKAVTGAVPLTVSLTLALGTGVAEARPLPVRSAAGSGEATASPMQDPMGEGEVPKRAVRARSALSADVGRARRAEAQTRYTKASSAVRPARPARRAGRAERGRTLHTRLGRAELSDRMRAAQRQAVRRQRTQMVRRWEARAARAVRYATWQIGTPYVWGGNGRGGFDCSGLTQQAWRHAGIKLPRVAADQFQRTRPHVPVNRLRPGDLVFFHGLGHVGIYAGKGLFIHSPHTGRTVTFERLRGWYRTHYVGAARPGWVPLPELPPAPPTATRSQPRSEPPPRVRPGPPEAQPDTTEGRPNTNETGYDASESETALSEMTDQS
ncbi:C40 family peptidase [Actinomadura rupiterrae]|uniref:C40 family peptidase n=1 Tax=Actinomadura rupiterrae TaxID=559627 RepID=UPI0020A2DC0A|nr:C40 family peptidase [Actinomadura rupiterrae]MCP2335263.1 cell wall-associated NlpC family hydrolase [Actinomadura rupiterrae]